MSCVWLYLEIGGGTLPDDLAIASSTGTVLRILSRPGEVEEEFLFQGGVGHDALRNRPRCEAVQQRQGALRDLKRRQSFVQ